MNEPPPRPETITRLFDAVYPSFAMLAGMELDLFTQLENGPLTTEQLANRINVQVTKLRPLLYALVVSGLLSVENELFSNKLEADHYLVRGKPGNMGWLREITSSNWFRVLETAETIRTGRPIEKVDYHSDSQDEMMAFFRGLYPGAVVDAKRLMDQYDFSTYRSLLDVGGGSGALAITMVESNPHLKATIIDLPSITPITHLFVEEANIADRVEILSGDVLRDSLSGSYDVIVARHVIQILSAADNRTLLNNLATVLKPGGVIYLVGWMLDNSRLSPKEIVGYNLVLLTAYKDGQAYTEQEYRKWLAETGFLHFKRVVMPDGASIVTARKQF
jgi:ubiquinone/menaquinone biosynthesis C-methylase UbiE